VRPSVPSFWERDFASQGERDLLFSFFLSLSSVLSRVGVLELPHLESRSDGLQEYNCITEGSSCRRDRSAYLDRGCEGDSVVAELWQSKSCSAERYYHQSKGKFE
jgi:hypothetical protein